VTVYTLQVRQIETNSFAQGKADNQEFYGGYVTAEKDRAKNARQ